MVLGPLGPDSEPWYPRGRPDRWTFTRPWRSLPENATSPNGPPRANRDDKYLPSYLILARHGSDVFHVLFAADVEGDNVRAVTSYRPDPGEWQADLKARRPKL
jgi:hypothetical protein